MYSRVGRVVVTSSVIDHSWIVETAAAFLDVTSYKPTLIMRRKINTDRNTLM